MTRAEIRERFLLVVARGLARAERERRAELARIQPRRRQTAAERARAHAVIAWLQR